MTREEALKLLADARYADDLQGNDDLQTAHIMAMEALRQETLPEPYKAESNATNGEMIQKMFPNGAVAVMSYPSNKVGFITRDGNPDDNYVWYPTDWWNAPYNVESEVKE